MYGIRVRVYVCRATTSPMGMDRVRGRVYDEGGVSGLWLGDRVSVVPECYVYDYGSS
jgi:hypothetical protein